MRTIRHFLLGLMSAVFSLAVLVSAASAQKAVWQTDFAAAQAKAKAENKLLLADFTGSDWCPWCQKLKAEVFDKKPFAVQAAKQFVLVQLDFPHEKELPAELKQQNDKLARQYGINTFPSILILHPNGGLIAHTGYREGGAEGYCEWLGDLLKTNDSLAGLRLQLPDAKGLDRAKLLDQLIDAYNKLGNPIAAIAGWEKEIINLDVDNQAGLKTKYQFRTMMAQVAAQKQAHKMDAALTTVEKILELPGLAPRQKQGAYLTVADYMGSHQGPIRTIAKLKEALEAAPASPNAPAVKEAIERLEERAKAEAAALKLKAEVAGASGPKRLKLLNQLIEEYGKLGNHIHGQDQSADVDKWRKEVADLAPENKVGSN